MKINKTELLEALANLDPDKDSDWTAEGLPSVDRVRELALDDEIERADITNNALGFDREVARSAGIAKDEVSKDDAQKLGDAKGLDELEPADPARKASLEERVQQAKQDLEDFDAAVAKAALRRAELTKEVDEATKALHAEYPPLRQADATKQWLASEHQKRLARSGAASDLDARFRKPLGYGNRRPSVPPVETQATR